MKKTKFFGILTSASLAAMAVSCASDEFSIGSSTGGISPVIDLDTEIVTARPQGRAAAAVSVGDLSLRLNSADGTVSKEWSKASDFNTNEEFRVGTYTMDAFYGSEEEEGFEKPYYFGTSTFEVEENRTTSVSLTASLANSMVTVDYTDAFKNYFASYDFKIHSVGGEYLDYAGDETRPIYLKSGKITILADIVKQNGVGAQLEAATFTAEPKHHYTVTVDVNGGQAGDAQLVIAFDDNVEEEDVTIDLSDELLNAPAPEISISGFNAGATYNLIEGSSLDIAPKYTILARGGISAVTMSTSSKTLEEQGWINEIDLCSASAAQQASLKALGLKAVGLFGNVDKMAVLDLSEVVKHIRYRENGSNTTTITVVVKDKIGKVTDPMTFTVEIEPIELTITKVSEVYPDDETVSFQFSYNGENPADNVTFMYKNNRGTWDAAETVSITPAARSSQLYNAVIKVPTALNTIVIKAVSNGVSAESEAVTTKRIIPEYYVTVNANDVFATYATLNVFDKDGNAVAAPSSATIQLSTNGGDFETKAYTADGTKVKITGLAGATEYGARIVFDEIPCPAAKFTTETKSQIPDSNFESWNATKKGDYQYLWTVNSGTPWATVNELTCSEPGSGSGSGVNTGGCAYKATSGTIPANGRSNYSNSYGGTFGTTKKSDGHTEGNATLHSDKGYSGNAALIRTVGYGSGNNAGSGTGNPASGFNTCKNVASGELFLGQYSEGANYSGCSFASRPSSISFYYKYTSYGSSGDYGDCEVKVLDASGNSIASATCQFTAQDAYAQKTLNLNYAAGSAKAAKIMVRFKSSANPSLANTSTWLYGPGNKNVSGGEYVGSELYVDEITLNY